MNDIQKEPKYSKGQKHPEQLIPIKLKYNSKTPKSNRVLYDKETQKKRDELEKIVIDETPLDVELNASVAPKSSDLSTMISTMEKESDKDQQIDEEVESKDCKQKETNSKSSDYEKAVTQKSRLVE